MLQVEADGAHVAEVLVNVMANDNDASLSFEVRLQDGPDGLAGLAPGRKRAFTVDGVSR